MNIYSCLGGQALGWDTQGVTGLGVFLDELQGPLAQCSSPRSPCSLWEPTVPSLEFVKVTVDKHILFSVLVRANAEGHFVGMSNAHFTFWGVITWPSVVKKLAFQCSPVTRPRHSFHTAYLTWGSKFTGLFLKTQMTQDWAALVLSSIPVWWWPEWHALPLLHWSILDSPSAAAKESTHSVDLISCGRENSKNTALLVNLFECSPGICNESLIALYKVRIFVLLCVWFFWSLKGGQGSISINIGIPAKTRRYSSWRPLREGASSSLHVPAH